MDLRECISNEDQLHRVKQLIVAGLFNYQPFIFSNDLEVGAGYEFLDGEFYSEVKFLIGHNIGREGERIGLCSLE